MSDETGTFTGEGVALLVGQNCSVVKDFTSTYKWSWAPPGPDAVGYGLQIVDYENSIIGKKRLSANYTNFLRNYDTTDIQIASTGSLTFITAYYFDFETYNYYLNVNIIGVHKKCNYSSNEFDFFVPPPNSKISSKLEALKKDSKSSEELHKLLDEKPHLKKIYLKIKAKLGK